MKSGIVILNKENGITSQGAVNRIKRLFETDKAGHTGTLDPLATGVLPILIGRAVKASEFLLFGNKCYSATLLLGVTTDTEDITGSVLTRCERIPSEQEVREAVASMLGRSMQTPPMYSAIKIGGKKLYDLAREGKVVDREPREICVYSIECEKLSDREYKIDVECSKGTYIRTLLSDIGKKLGTGGTMATLTRTRAAKYDISEAHTLAEIEAMTREEREALVIATEDIFEDRRRIDLPPFFARLARCGVEIYIKKIGVSAEISEQFTLWENGKFFALGEARDFGGEIAIKPIRQFDV